MFDFQTSWRILSASVWWSSIICRRQIYAVTNGKGLFHIFLISVILRRAFHSSRVKFERAWRNSTKRSATKNRLVGDELRNQTVLSVIKNREPPDKISASVWLALEGSSWTIDQIIRVDILKKIFANHADSTAFDNLVKSLRMHKRLTAVSTPRFTTSAGFKTEEARHAQKGRALWSRIMTCHLREKSLLLPGARGHNVRKVGHKDFLAFAKPTI